MGVTSSDDFDAGGGTLDTSASMSLGVLSTPTSFDPALSRVPYVSDAQFLSPVYDQLRVLDEDLQIAPLPASAWEMSEDGMALTLTLRTDVTFQDGSAFDQVTADCATDWIDRHRIERPTTGPDLTLGS
ncbi:hypothetical protein [Blastococcus sp. URHD0036]|uniref:hypothetical protein n=1 Tax=Blastococcus sp. URHD0036 TaxID=1380356 RepID=UPI0004962E2A|nr:hypothetical protein [Blastococcus sp. URHD0036]